MPFICNTPVPAERVTALSPRPRATAPTVSVPAPVPRRLTVALLMVSVEASASLFCPAAACSKLRVPPSRRWLAALPTVTEPVHAVFVPARFTTVAPPLWVPSMNMLPAPEIAPVPLAPKVKVPAPVRVRPCASVNGAAARLMVRPVRLTQVWVALVVTNRVLELAVSWVNVRFCDARERSMPPAPKVRVFATAAPLAPAPFRIVIAPTGLRTEPLNKLPTVSPKTCRLVLLLLEIRNVVAAVMKLLNRISSADVNATPSA